MKPGETIANIQKRFTHIVNHLIGLGKVFDKEELNIKILKFLDKSWQSKVTAISETRNLTILTTVTLFGKVEAWTGNEQTKRARESGERKLKGIALKFVVKERGELW